MGPAVHGNRTTNRLPWEFAGAKLAGEMLSKRGRVLMRRDDVDEGQHTVVSAAYSEDAAGVPSPETNVRYGQPVLSEACSSGISK